jgi:ABC-type sugar transport system substrate-binding protein
MKKLALAITLSLAALGSTAIALGPTAASAQERIVVGGIVYARDSQYWQQVEKGMADAAKALDVDLQVALNRRQLPTEGQVIEDFITRGVKAIVMPPLDRQASVAAAKRAKERGIVIVDYDAPLADPAIASHTIGVDSVALAREVGNEIRRTVDGEFEGSASLGIILVPPTNPNMQGRRKGLAEALEGAKIDYVAEVTASTPEQGATALENILQRRPSTQLIWASNSGSLAGAAAAAKRSRSRSKAKLFGIDMSKDLAELLLDPQSNLQAVSDQQPYKIGYSAVEAAVKTLRGETLPRKIEIPVRLYTKRDTQAINEYLDLLKSL